MNLFLLKIDKFVNEDMKCFCVRDMRNRDGFNQALLPSDDRRYKGEIVQTGSFGECLAYCAGFAKAIYHDWREIASITKDAEKLRKEIYL